MVDHARRPHSDAAFLATAAARRPPLPSLGDIVDGKYRLVKTLGEGGMGVVLEAEHLVLGHRVAIKFLRPDAMDLPEATARFEREARASIRMGGPHVVVDVEGRPYIVMEHLRGRDLDAELHARGPLPIAEAVDRVLQACEAVADAHRSGIVHRDLKPSNLFLAEGGYCEVNSTGCRDDSLRRPVVKVLDFGISKMAREPEPCATATATTMGTPLYMSPEQLRSSRDVDERTDIWALGVILYELAAGAPPFRGTTTAAIAAIVADATPSLTAVRSDAPAGLDRVLATALAKSPDHRFPNVEALAAALLPFATPELRRSSAWLRRVPDAARRAKSAMARAPVGRRVSDASELLVLRPSGSATRRELPHVYRDALRTFCAALALGTGFAAAATGLASGMSVEDRSRPHVARAPETGASSIPRVALFARARAHGRVAGAADGADASVPAATESSPRR
jgi:serine/threonine-protein kinase